MREDERLEKVKRERPVDRRFQKTKSLLRVALANAMREKSIREITVKELVESAGINRSTFYLHYTDIYQMVRKIEEEIIDSILEVIEADKETPLYINCLSVMEAICDIFIDNKYIIQVLLSSNSNGTFVYEVEKIIEKGIDTVVKEKYSNKVFNDNYAYSFCVSGCVGLIVDWLKEERPKSSAYIAKIIYNMISHSIKSAYGGVDISELYAEKVM